MPKQETYSHGRNNKDSRDIGKKLRSIGGGRNSYSKTSPPLGFQKTRTGKKQALGGGGGRGGHAGKKMNPPPVATKLMRLRPRGVKKGSASNTAWGTVGDKPDVSDGGGTGSDPEKKRQDVGGRFLGGRPWVRRGGGTRTYHGPEGGLTRGHRAEEI